MRQGPLIILSGPSGAGKSTLIARLLEDKTLPLRVSISATTRAPRRGEVPGVDYHFLSRERFEAEVRQGAFLEWAEVHGERYGTLRSEVDSYLPAGVGVILVIDVQGAAQVRRLYPQALSLFLRTPSLELLEQRLRFRGTEAEEVIQRRLEAARREMERMNEYDHILVSDLVEASVAQMHDLIASRFTEG